MGCEEMKTKLTLNPDLILPLILSPTINTSHRQVALTL